MPELSYWVQTSDAIPSSFQKERVESLLNNDFGFHEVSIIAVSRHTMRGLNQSYKGRDLSTDILTFTAEEGSGDLFICPKNVLFYACYTGIPFEVRWWHLIIHGLSHLKNLDHELYAEAELFAQDEKKRWAMLSVQLPYLKAWSWDSNYIYKYQGD